MAGIVVLVELAGIRSTDIEITLQGNRLHVEGNRLRSERRGLHDQGNGEVKFGRFHAALEFPEGYDTTRSKASYLNGFLRIDVPEAEGTRRIEV
jgi:HSP20 family protein